ncbi:hypothetical protein SLA2020_084660 [Shorea laevis]
MRNHLVVSAPPASSSDCLAIAEMENNPFSEVDAPTSDVSTEANPSVSSNSAESHPNHLNNGSTEAVAKALSSTLTSLIQDFDSKAQNALDSQDQLNSALNCLTRELDQLLEDAPLPFIIQHASKISGTEYYKLACYMRRLPENIPHNICITCCATVRKH